MIHLLVMGILVLSLFSQRGVLAAEGCSIKITRISPSRLPQAIRPGETIVKFWFDLRTSDPRNTQLGIRASGDNIDVLSTTISVSTKSGSIMIYVHPAAGERASLTIRVSCHVNGFSDSDSRDLGSSYIVYIPPSWSPSVSPREIGKRGKITLRADGLGDVDDGVGTLSVTAKVGSSIYTLRRVSKGIFETERSVNFVNSPSGIKKIIFTVTKSYGGITAISRRDTTIRVLGSPPTLRIISPSQIHRGDVITVVVSENDGDSLTGVLSAFGKEYELKKGENSIEVPKDIDAGQHHIRATVMDVDGNNSDSQTLEILNVPPHVEASLDKDLAVPGDIVSVHVSVEDDSTGVSVELVVVGNGIRDRFELDENGGTVKFRIPDGFSGELTFTANAIDRDGASSSSTKSVIVGIPPSISGDIPRVVHRGEEYSITVRGDEVSGYLEFMGEKDPIDGEGVYQITIPKDIKAGDYEITAYAVSPFGEISERWRVVLENRPPAVDVSVSPSKAFPGEIVTISASYSDDAPGLRVTLHIDGKAIHLSGSKKHIKFTVPEGKRVIEITIEAVDIDGAVAKDSVILVVKGSPGPDDGTGDNTTGREEVSYDDQRAKDQFDTGSKNSGKEDGASSPLRFTGTFSITVVPSDPEVGDDISVTAVPYGARGSVWIVDPNGTTVKEVLVRNRTTFHFVASKEGIWSVRWAYTSGGKTLFDHMELNVTAPPRRRSVSHKARNDYRSLSNENTLTTLSEEAGGEIRVFKPSCRVLREESPRSWDIEMVTVVIAASLVGLFMARRRVS